MFFRAFGLVRNPLFSKEQLLAQSHCNLLSPRPGLSHVLLVGQVLQHDHLLRVLRSSFLSPVRERVSTLLFAPARETEADHETDHGRGAL